MQLDLVAEGFCLLEGPVWDAEHGLLFADAEGGGVYGLQDGQVRTVVPHRRGIGGMALHKSGGLVVGGRNLAYKCVADQTTVVLVDNDVERSLQVGFSDLTTSPSGQVYAGTLGQRPDANGKVGRGGGLYLIDLDGSCRAVIPSPQVRHTNGLAFSPDGRYLYYADSGYRAVFRYRVDIDGGLSEKHLFAELTHGVPDGLAVAMDGSVWVAAAFAGALLVYDRNGILLHSVKVPVDLVTNVCFGGNALTDVYVTTGALDASVKDGRVFRMCTDVAGVKLQAAKIRLPISGPVPNLCTEQHVPS